jgi:hypothetical protein
MFHCIHQLIDTIADGRITDAEDGFDISENSAAPDKRE